MAGPGCSLSSARGVARVERTRVLNENEPTTHPCWLPEEACGTDCTHRTFPPCYGCHPVTYWTMFMRFLIVWMFVFLSVLLSSVFHCLLSSSVRPVHCLECFWSWSLSISGLWIGVELGRSHLEPSTYILEFELGPSDDRHVT